LTIDDCGLLISDFLGNGFYHRQVAKGPGSTHIHSKIKNQKSKIKNHQSSIINHHSSFINRHSNPNSRRIQQGMAMAISFPLRNPLPAPSNRAGGTSSSP